MLFRSRFAAIFLISLISISHIVETKIVLGDRIRLLNEDDIDDDRDKAEGSKNGNVTIDGELGIENAESRKDKEQEVNDGTSVVNRKLDKIDESESPTTNAPQPTAASAVSRLKSWISGWDSLGLGISKESDPEDSSKLENEPESKSKSKSLWDSWFGNAKSETKITQNPLKAAQTTPGTGTGLRLGELLHLKPLESEEDEEEEHKMGINPNKSNVSQHEPAKSMEKTTHIEKVEGTQKQNSSAQQTIEDNEERDGRTTLPPNTTDVPTNNIDRSQKSRSEPSEVTTPASSIGPSEEVQTINATIRQNQTDETEHVQTTAQAGNDANTTPEKPETAQLRTTPDKVTPTVHSESDVSQPKSNIQPKEDVSQQYPPTESPQEAGDDKGIQGHLGTSSDYISPKTREDQEQSHDSTEGAIGGVKTDIIEEKSPVQAVNTPADDSEFEGGGQIEHPESKGTIDEKINDINQKEPSDPSQLTGDSSRSTAQTQPQYSTTSSTHAENTGEEGKRPEDSPSPQLSASVDKDSEPEDPLREYYNENVIPVDVYGQESPFEIFVGGGGLSEKENGPEQPSPSPAETSVASTGAPSDSRNSPRASEETPEVFPDSPKVSKAVPSDSPSTAQERVPDCAGGCPQGVESTKNDPEERTGEDNGTRPTTDDNVEQHSNEQKTQPAPPRRRYVTSIPSCCEAYDAFLCPPRYQLPCTMGVWS